MAVLALTLMLVALGVVLVRAGWGGQRGAAAAGWALAITSLGWLSSHEGAWGLAVGLVAGSIAALALVLHAGAISPVHAGRVPRRAADYGGRLITRKSLALGRRLSVFALTVPVSFLAAQWLALAVLAAMKGSGELNANSVATMLFAQPTVWAILVAWQVTLPGPRAMLLPPALAAVLGTLLWLAA